MVSPSMILSSLGKKRLYSQPFYGLRKTTKTTFSAVRSHSIVKKGGGSTPVRPTFGRQREGGGGLEPAEPYASYATGGTS